MRRTVNAFFALCAALALVFGSLSLAQAAEATSGPSVVSDQADYAPGSHVTLTGAGWAAGESVHVTVDDVQGQTWQWQGDAQAGDAGGFELGFDLPNWFVADYSVLADNGVGTTASAYFTDSNVQVGALSGTTKIVAGVLWTTYRKSASCSGTTLNTGKVNTVTNGQGVTGTSGVGNQTAMGLVADNPVVYAGRVYNFSSWTGDVSGSSTTVCVPGDTLNGKITAIANYTDSGTAGKTPQTITFNALGDKTFGDADFNVSATASSGLTVIFSASGVCTVTGTLVHITGGGDCTITADQAGNGSYYPAPSLPRSFTVNPGSTAVTLSCPASQVYTGLALEPCTATATGSGLNQTLTVAYVNNLDVGTATASASYAGDSTHAAGSGSTTFGITQAGTSISITCPPSVTYDGSAQTPCTASVSGASLSQTLTPSYSNNTSFGTANVTAAFAGDPNHTGSSNSTTFAINKAESTTTITCTSPVTYTGSALTPCSAVATGAGGLDQSVPVTYGNNTAAGSGTASASFGGDTNHTSSSDSDTFTISAAGSAVQITCPTSVTYSGSAQEPCTAKATGTGGLNQTLTVSYSANTDAGTATASASFGGDANHDASSNSATFAINKADTTTTVSCPTNVTYDGSAQEPCSASVTGPGLSQTVPVTYEHNTNAGTAGVSASFAGDSNYNGSSDTDSFTIDPAVSVVSVSCPPSVTYNGSDQTPCTASYTGVGITSPVSLSVTYSDNTDAGTAHASASWAGDANHTGDDDSATFAILKAASSTVVTCPVSNVYTGSALVPCTAAVTGIGGLNQALSVVHTDNVTVGTATATASYAGDSNHNGSDDTKHFEITKAPSTTTITCTLPVTYTGSAIEPCGAVATGAGGLSQPVTVVYTNNTNAGTAGASASYGGDANHDGSDKATTFAIGKAGSTTTVTCSSPQTYSGSPITTCTATATGIGGLSTPVSVSFTNNTNAGSAGALATYAGDDNHTGSTGSSSFVINKASSTTMLSCPSSVIYTGAPRTPCTATTSGAGINPAITLTPTYSNNTNAGTAGASASWPGDANHDSSSANKSFEISQASSVVTVTCSPASVTYTGSPIEPCTAKATGDGMSDVPLAVTYAADHTNVSTSVSASASWAGDANHTGNTGNSTFAITKATLTVTADNKRITYGDALPTYTYQVSGYVNGEGSAAIATFPTCNAVGVTSNTGAGSYDITCSGALANNYTFSYAKGALIIDKKAGSLGYTGGLFWSTAAASATSTSVTFQGLFTPAAGGNPDLTKAPVVFEIYKSTNLAMATPDFTCNGTVSSTGVVTCSMSLGLDNWTVIMSMPSNAYFTAPDSDPVVLTVYQPATDKFATGGGWVVDPQGSAVNQHGNFGFTVRYKSGTTPSGQAVYVYRGTDGYNYVIKSNSWQGGGLSFGTNTVSFSAKANVTVINRATGLAVTGLGGGNYTFRVDATDNGSPGSSDSYAISVYAPSGSLYHQAGTTGTQLVLGGGNVTIHSTAK